MKSRTFAPGTALAAFLLSSAAALAAEPAATAGARATAATPNTASAVRVIRDAATGKLRHATAEEAAAMSSAERADRIAKGLPDPAADAPVAVRVHANGMVSAELGTEHLVSVQARRGADGRLIRSHTHPSMDHPATERARPANSRPVE